MKNLLSFLYVQMVFFIFEPALIAQPGGIGSAFLTCSLRHQIELDLPATWEIAGASTLAELRNAAHAKIDLAKLPVKQLGEYEALLMAHGENGVRLQLADKFSSFAMRKAPPPLSSPPMKPESFAPLAALLLLAQWG